MPLTPGQIFVLKFPSSWYQRKNMIFMIYYIVINGIKLYCRMRSKAGSRFILRFWRLIERVSLKVCQTSCNHPQPFAAVCKCHIGVPLVEAAKRLWIMTFTCCIIVSTLSSQSSLTWEFAAAAAAATQSSTTRY